jgi:phenylalanine-4-hydroxylase
LSRVFWFTLEFGVVEEGGELKAYGAGLLSSYGELDVFRQAEVRDWDLVAMGTCDYDITHYQPVLFAARSYERLLVDLGDFFRRYDEAWFRAHVRASHVWGRHTRRRRARGSAA